VRCDAVHPQIQQQADHTMPGLSVEDRGGRRRCNVEVERRRDWNVDPIHIHTCVHGCMSTKEKTEGGEK